MTEYVVELEQGAYWLLEASFHLRETIAEEARPTIPAWIKRVDPEPQRRERHFLPEHTVFYDGRVKVEVFSNEHPPPHFRIKYKSETGNYAIEDRRRLNAGRTIQLYEREIKRWWRRNKGLLIQAWNERRPSDCPVGEYQE